MSNQFEIGSELFVGFGDDVFVVAKITEKAIYVQSPINPKRKGWLAKSALLKQPKHKDAHPSTPDTYKIAKWMNLNF